MLASQIPAKFQVPFAADATPGTTIRTIPLTTSAPGAASFELGFPPLTFTPIPSGGQAPDGRDFNGILNASTSWDQWFQAGGPVAWDSAFSTAIGGYMKGSVVAAATLGNYWISTADNNTSDPDTGGANWAVFLPGLLNIQVFTSSGPYTPTSGTNKIIVEVVGGGAGGGGAPATTSGQISVGAPGPAGAYGKSLITSGFAGTTVTVGAQGVGRAGAAGTAGGTSSFGAFVSAPGGPGGVIFGPSTNLFISGGAVSAIATGGNIINATGGPSGVTFTLNDTGDGFGGPGGSSFFGGGGTAVPASFNGSAAQTPGSGGSGTSNAGAGSALTGGNGAPGIVIIYELR
jgi:hypothetical protein